MISLRKPVITGLSALAVVASASLTACGGGGGGSAGAGNPSLVTLTTSTIPSASTGAAYVAPIEAVFPHPPGKFLIKGGALPPGLKLDQDSGEITGFPRQTGQFSFDVAARDGVDQSIPQNRDATFAEDVRNFGISVALGPPHILPQTIPSAQYRASYAYQVDVAGGTAPYTFAQTGGTLPNGITVGATGVLGNFPTQASPAPGVPYEFDVTVTDANGLTDTAHFTLDVLVLPLLILTSSIPQAAKDFPYDVTMALASQGGGQPISWSQNFPLAAGEVDLNTIGMEISIDGHLRNRLPAPGPSVLGTSKFTLKVTDEPGQIATRQFSLIVNPGPVLTSITPNRASAAGPFTVNGSNFQSGAKLYFLPGPTQVVITPTFVSPVKLTFSTVPPAPVGGAGAIPVMVVNPDNGAFTLSGAFVYPAATISFNTKGFIPSVLSSTGLDCADVNGDGRADVVHCGVSGMTTYGGSATSTNGGLILHMNLGGSPPTFGSTLLDSGNFTDVKFADVNLDGKIDIVALGATQVKVWLNGVLGNPLGTFSAGPVSNMPGGWTRGSQMSIGKINSDAIPDLAFGVPRYPSSITNGAVYTMSGDGSGGFAPLDSNSSSMPTTYGVVALQLLDTDGDGRCEFLAGIGMNSYSGPVFNYSNVGTTGLFTGWSGRGGSITAPAYGECTGMAAGDYLGNGTPAVITLFNGAPAYSNTRMLTLWTGSGLSTQTNLTAATVVMKSVCAIDADFDAKMDWAVTTQTSGILVYRGSSQSSVATLDASVGSPAISAPRTGRIASGDLDGDGKPDLVATTSCWFVETMAANYGTTYVLSTTGNGGSMGIVFFLNTSN